MPKIEVTAFSGMIPKRADNLLPDTAATVAENCKLTDGTLRPYHRPLLVETLAQSADTLYLYRDGQSTHWFSFAGIVDVVPSPVADDGNNAVYLSGTVNGARWTNNILALTGGSQYPVNTRALGLPAPNAPVATITGAADEEAEGFFTESRFYVTTWVTEEGKEGPPSDPSGEVLWQLGQTVELAVDSTPVSVDRQITHLRVYVTRGDGYWWLCEQVSTTLDGEIGTDTPVGQATLYDRTPTDERRESLKTIGWQAPPINLQGLRLLPGGIGVGFQGKELCFSVPYVLDAWPLAYRQTLPYNIVAVEVAGNSVLITTTGNPYLCFGTDPLSMTVQRLDASQTCVSKRSMVDMGYQALYASPDGLVALTGNSAQLITGDIIRGEQWRERYRPEQLKAFFHDGKYFAFHDTGGFLFDPASGALTDITLTPDCGYSDLMSDTLYLCTDQQISAWDHGSEPLPYRWRSRVYQGRPIKLNCARIMAHSYDDLRFRLYRDGQLVMDILVVNDRGFRLPAGRGGSYQFELAGTDQVTSVTLASSMSIL